MIRTLEGRVGAGKTSKVLREVANASLAGRRALLIVPEQTTLQTELALAKVLEAPGFLTTEVLSPSRLVQRVNEAAGGMAGQVPIDEQGRLMALRAVVHELDKSLLVYRGCGGRVGFMAWLAELMQEFSQSDIASTDLRLAADALPEGLVSKKLYDLAAIADGYHDMLRGRFLDTTDTIDLFLKNVHRVEFLKNTSVWVDGFDIMPPRTLRIMVGLATAVQEITIALTMDTQSSQNAQGLFDPVAQSFGRLHALAQASGMEVSRERLPREIYTSKEIGHLEQEWDAQRIRPYADAPTDLHLLAADTPFQECEAVASKILSLHREQGMPFANIACALGNEDTYAPLLKRSFQSRGIPFFIAQPISFQSHPAMRYWLAAMEAATTGMRAEHMGQMLRTGWWGGDEDDADLLMNHIFRHNLRGKAFERPLTNDPLLESARVCLLHPLLSYQRRVKDKPTVREMAHAAYLLLEDAGIYPRLLSHISQCEAQGQGVVASQHAQVWRQVLLILDLAVELLGDKALPHKEFLLMLSAGLEGAQLQALPPQPDQVMVTTVGRVKGTDVRVLFVLGLNDGILPGISAGDGLLGDQERVQVNAVNAKIGSTVRLNGPIEQDQAERFSFYGAITLPTHALYLSYAHLSQEGNALRPSILITRLRTIFPRLTPTSYANDTIEFGKLALWQCIDRIRKSHDSDLIRKSHDSDLIRKSHDAVGNDDDSTAWAAYRYFCAQSEMQAELDQIRQSLFYKKPATLALEPTLAHQLFGNRPMGITRVERFALCPCQHYIQHGLSPKLLYQPGFQPMDTGKFYHEVLGNLIQSIDKHGLGWEFLDHATLAKLVTSEATPFLQELRTNSNYEGGQAQALIAQYERTLHKTAQVIAYQLKNSRFLPIGQEIAFGRDTPYPALTLHLPSGQTVDIEGRIDRIDRLPSPQGNYLRIIDYKSADTKFLLSSFAQGLTLQLPIYAIVAESAFSAKTAGFFYSRIADTMILQKPDQPDTPPISHVQAMAKAHKLQGMMLDDPALAIAMDSQLEERSVLPLSLNKDGSFRVGSPVLSPCAMSDLLSQAKQTTIALLDRMIGGEITPLPATDKGQSACKFCSFLGICGIKD